MLRIVVIFAVIMLSSGCSRTDLAYRNADWLLEYYAGQAVDVSGVQREEWQPVVVGTLRRHRENELPLVIAYLDLARATGSQTEGSVGAACLVEGGLLLLRRHARLAVDLAVPLLADLDKAQIEHLRDYATGRQQEAVDEYLNPDPQRRMSARRERFMDRIEAWIGQLSVGQRQLVDGALQRIPDLSVPWLAYRARQTERLLQLLNSRASAAALREFLLEWWVEQGGRSPEHERLWRSAKREFVRFVDALGNTLSKPQRATLEKRLGKLRKELASFLSPNYTPANLIEAEAICASESVRQGTREAGAVQMAE